MKKKEKKQKIKKERKPMSNTDKFMLVFLATLIIYLAIILPIRICVVPFSWHWFVFGLVAVVIPFAFIHFQLWSQKKLSFADDQKKNANVVTVKYILYFWFLDCLYMVIFNQWILWIYILGIITLVKIFYGLAVTFLGKKQKNAILDISIVFDFLLGVGLTVYLIYLIPDEFNNLQTIVTAIIAAVYGGLLTLVGVAWTIKKGDKDRKEDLERHDREKMEEERKRLVPYIKISIGDNITSFVNAELHKINLNEDYQQEKIWYCFTIKEFCIKNISVSNLLILGVSLNGKYYEFAYNQLVEQNGVCQVQTTRNWDYICAEPLRNLKLIVSDIIGNRYSISCKFSTELKGTIKDINEQDETVVTRYGSTHTVESVSIPEYISKES